jgi:hypothetical protein
MNIIQLLQDHLPSAIEDLDDEITKAYNTISLLESRRLQLQRIANAAGITVRESAPSRLKDSTLNGTEINAR